MQLIKNITKTNQYLAQKTDIEPKYNQLIDELEQIASTIAKPKPIVKIVSRSAVLVEKIKQISEADEQLRSLYQFETVSPIKDLRKIITDCDLICYGYSSNQTISEFEKKLIERSHSANIIQIILVEEQTGAARDYPSNCQTLTTWIEQQNYSQINTLKPPIGNFFDFNSQTLIQNYQHFLVELNSRVLAQLESRTQEKVIHTIKQYFGPEKASIWTEIRELRDLYAEGEYIDAFRQKINKTVAKINREQHQYFRKIKQIIHQSKNELTNPFLENSLMYQIQQKIQEAQVRQVKENQNVYLYLEAVTPVSTELIHNHIADLCQQRITEIIDTKWQQINDSYLEGGLKKLSDNITEELKLVGKLYPHKIAIASGNKPDFELSQEISLAALRNNSRIPFDYHFTQSSWFRLLVSVLFGIAIYLVTKIILGTGRYYGFVILFFQIINLATGQNVKTIKLRQQTKELKRIVDGKYQVLVRFLVERVVQELVTALDNESQSYQQQIDEIATSVNDKLTEIKQTVTKHKERVDHLKQDQEKVLSYFQ